MSGLPAQILLRLIDDLGLDLKQTLMQLPYILEGYFEEKERHSDDK
jgi:hypothetical protein